MAAKGSGPGKVAVKKKEVAEPARTGTVLSPLDSLRQEVDSVFDRFFQGWPSIGDLDPFRAWARPLALPRADMAPQADVSETDKAYEIAVELPGIDEKDVELTLKGGVVTLKGEKKTEREEKKKDFHLTERSYGSFQRSFRLPEDVDVDKIDAAFSKGVMRISLPKLAEAKTKTRKISVKAG